MEEASVAGTTAGGLTLAQLIKDTCTELDREWEDLDRPLPSVTAEILKKCVEDENCKKASNPDACCYQKLVAACPGTPPVCKCSALSSSALDDKEREKLCVGGVNVPCPQSCLGIMQ